MIFPRSSNKTDLLKLVLRIDRLQPTVRELRSGTYSILIAMTKKRLPALDLERIGFDMNAWNELSRGAIAHLSWNLLEMIIREEHRRNRFCLKSANRE